MSKEEWFRRTTWTPADEEHFLARLRRSRTVFHRSQYLRIQAWTLVHTGEPHLVAPALRLLDLLIREHPHHSQLSSAHHLRGICLVDLGRIAEALDAFRAALAARRSAPQWGDDGHLDYGELVCALQRRELYAEVTAALEEFGQGAPFPAQAYKYHAIMAVLADARMDRSSASAHARSALVAANATESPFRRHRRLGLVTQVDPLLLATLQALAA